MPEAPILPIDAPILKQVSNKVTSFDAELKQLIEFMFVTMDNAHGAGLAAVQIGILKRIIVVDAHDINENRHRLALINPEIITTSHKYQFESEGCLSMPGYDISVKRAAEVSVKYQSAEGIEEIITATGILAIALQHEIDHTNGIVYTQRVSPLKRRIANEYFSKVRKQYQRLNHYNPK